MNFKGIVLSTVLFFGAIGFSSELARNQWTFEVNEDEVRSEYSTGLIVPDDWQELAPFVSFRDEDPLPKKFDWRERGAVTEVKNQGRCGSCWAFGTVAVMESAIKIATGKTVDISEQQLVSCRPRFGSCGGGYFALGFYEQKGAGYTEEYPYLGRNARCKNNVEEHEKITKWGYVGEKGKTPSTEEIKRAIFKHGPVAVTVSASGAFHGYKSGVYNACNQRNTNHIVTLVGWNDEEEAWIMKNSWGKKWGEEGYMRIRYTGPMGGKCNRIGQSAVFGIYSK